MALPIGPHDLFVAAFDEQLTNALPNVDPTKLAYEMNRDVVSSARQFVWGLDDGQIDFVRTWINSVPDRVILTETQRQNPDHIPDAASPREYRYVFPESHRFRRAGDHQAP